MLGLSLGIFWGGIPRPESGRPPAPQSGLLGRNFMKEIEYFFIVFKGFQLGFKSHCFTSCFKIKMIDKIPRAFIFGASNQIGIMS